MPKHLTDIRDELRQQRIRSAALYDRACHVIPSGTVSRARILQPLPFYTARGAGARLIDADGREFVDCCLGFGFNLLGHAHPIVVQAIREAVEDGTGYGTPHRREVELAERLVDAIPCADKVTFCNSGSEATLNAIRIARAVTGRPGLAIFEGGYHGWYDAVVGSLGPEPMAGPQEDPQFVSYSIGVPEENLAHTYVLPFNHHAAFAKIRRLKDRLALVLVEGIQGAGGAIAADREFLQELRRVCDEAGVLLLMDEIITGFRVARGGAQEYFGVRADLATYSKALSGGLPLGIIAGTSAVMSRLGSTGDAARDRRERVYYGGTFNGGVLPTAVAIAIFDHLERHPGTFERLNALGARLREGLAAVVAEEEYPATVVGDASLFMLRFVPGVVRSVRDLAAERTIPYRELFLRLARHGVFVPTSHFGLLSAVHTDADVDFIVEAYRRSLGELRAAGHI